MRVSDILQAAEEIGVAKSYALECRKRYLVGRLWDLDEELAEAMADLASEDDWEVAVAICRVSDIDRERRSIKRETTALHEVGRREDEVTEEMKERAREYPVLRLVELHRGKAKAWCHDDKNPSLTYMTKRGRLWCPVCDRYFDAIGVLMSRDGYAFHAAVRALQ